MTVPLLWLLSEAFKHVMEALRWVGPLDLPPLPGGGVRPEKNFGPAECLEKQLKNLKILAKSSPTEQTIRAQNLSKSRPAPGRKQSLVSLENCSSTQTRKNVVFGLCFIFPPFDARTTLGTQEASPKKQAKNFLPLLCAKIFGEF